MQHFILGTYSTQGNKPAEAQLVRGFSETGEGLLYISEMD